MLYSCQGPKGKRLRALCKWIIKTVWNTMRHSNLWTWRAITICNELQIIIIIGTSSASLILGLNAEDITQLSNIISDSLFLEGTISERAPRTLFGCLTWENSEIWKWNRRNNRKIAFGNKSPRRLLPLRTDLGKSLITLLLYSEIKCSYLEVPTLRPRTRSSTHLI